MGKFKDSKIPGSNGQNSYLDSGTEIFDRDTIKMQASFADEEETGREPVRKRSYVWTALRPVLMVLISIGFVVLALFIGYEYVYSNYIKPPDEGDNRAITVEIKRGSSVSAIAEILEEKGLIKNKTVFKFYVDFSDMTSKLKAGTYTLSKNMTMDEIIYTLTKGDGKPKVTKFTVTEGMSVEDMAKSLLSKGVIKSKEDFLKLCREGTEFYNYAFIAELDPAENGEETGAESEEAMAVAEKSKRKYMLEGYLFPDTYEIFTDSSNETIIKKMLDRFNVIFNDTFVKRAEEQNMTIDEVVTLASIIEREGKPQDFKKISAVFHNRLKKGMILQSDATLEYALGVKKYRFTEEEKKNASPYNTYNSKNKGLPPGAIANPGKNAIEAALYPDEQYIKDKYLYFYTVNPETGETVFSKDLKSHNKVIEKAKPIWDAYIKAHPELQ